MKKKTKEEQDSEEKAFEDWQKTIRTEKTLKKKADVLEDFWNITDDIDDDEKFLRDYILNERWKEDSKPGLREKKNWGRGRGGVVFCEGGNFFFLSFFLFFFFFVLGFLSYYFLFLGDLDIDSEDEEEDEKAEKFENAYNFRFALFSFSFLFPFPTFLLFSIPFLFFFTLPLSSLFSSFLSFRHEEGGDLNNVVGHSRNQPESMRNDQSKRKSQRERKKEKEREEKVKRQEELKRLKNFKRKEMEKKLMMAAEIAGLDVEKEVCC